MNSKKDDKFGYRFEIIGVSNFERKKMDTYTKIDSLNCMNQISDSIK